MAHKIDKDALAKTQDYAFSRTCIVLSRESCDYLIAESIKTYLAAAATPTPTPGASIDFAGARANEAMASPFSDGWIAAAEHFRAEVKRLSDREQAFGARVGCPVGRFRLEWAEEHIGDLRRNALAAAAEATRLRRLLERGMALANGLMCLGCGGGPRQGRSMPLGCCRDADCDAGFFGIDADEVKGFLEAADEAIPGTLARLEEESKLPKADDGIEGADRI